MAMSPLRNKTAPLSRFVLTTMLLFSMETAVAAQVPFLPDQFERVDVIGIERDRRELFAFDSLTGSRRMIRLDVGENVVFEGSRGRVGVVVTDRRVLGVAPGTGWIEERLRLEENLGEAVLVEDRLALLVSNRRALAFSEGRWIEESFSPQEVATSLRVGAAVGAVTTNRRALGIAPRTSGFIAEDLQVREGLESVSAEDTLATVRTERRILVFSGLRGGWSIQRRRIR